MAETENGNGVGDGEEHDFAAIIGIEGADADWELRPEQHAELIVDREKAGALLRVLAGDDIAKIAAGFEHEDKAAGRAQRRYKFWARTAIHAGLVAMLVGALYLLPWPGWLASAPGVNVRFGPLLATIGAAAVLVEYGFLALAFFADWWARLRGYYIDWQRDRAHAEMARADLFDRVMAKLEGAAPARPGEAALLPLALEYFRRFQLDVQRRYYKQRGAEHARGAGRSFWWRWFSHTIYLLVFLIAVPSALALIEQMGWLSAPWLNALFASYPWMQSLAQAANNSLLGIGVITSAIWSTNTARSRMDMDERNAARYRLTWRNLETLAGEPLEAARRAARAGDVAAVMDFVRRVQDQISTEHREWVLLRAAEEVGAQPAPVKPPAPVEM